MVERGFLPDSVPPDDKVGFESLVGIQPGDSGVVMGYQANIFSYTWSAYCSVA